MTDDSKASAHACMIRRARHRTLEAWREGAHTQASAAEFAQAFAMHIAKTSCHLDKRPVEVSAEQILTWLAEASA